MKIVKKTENKIVIEMNNGEKITVEQHSKGMSSFDVKPKFVCDGQEGRISELSGYLHNGQMSTPSIHTRNTKGLLRKETTKLGKGTTNVSTLSYEDKLGMTREIVDVFTEAK